MLWALAVVLVALWALGVVTSITVGGLIHLLLVAAAAAVMFRILGAKQGLRIGDSDAEPPTRGPG